MKSPPRTSADLLHCPCLTVRRHLFQSIVLFFLLLLLQGVLIAQKTPYVNWDVSSGLPSNMSFHVIKDSEGYIWVATSEGIARFDGYEFKIFTVADGLPASPTLKFWPDAKGRLWGQSYPNAYYTIEDGKVIPYRHNDFMKTLPDWKGADGRPPWNEERQELSIYQTGKYKRIDSSGANSVTRLSNDPKAIRKLILIENENGIFPLHTTKLLNDPALDSLEGRLTIDSVGIGRQVYYPVRAGDKIYVGVDNHLYVFDAQGRVNKKTFSKDVVYCKVSPSGNVVIGLYRGGMQILNADLVLQRTMLPDKTPSSFFWDDADGLWVTTLQTGLFYFPSNSFSIHPRIPKNQIVGFTLFEDDLIVVCEDGKVVSASNNTPLPNQKLIEKFRDLEMVRWLDGEPWLIGRLKDPNIEFDSSLRIVDGYAALMEGNNLFSISNQNLKVHFLDKNETRVIYESPSNLYDIFFYKGTLLVCSQEGLIAFDTHTFERVGCPIPSWENLQLYGFGLMEEGVLSAPSTGGLIYVDDSSSYELNEKNGLFSNRVHSHYIFGDEAWVGAAGGISLVKRQENGSLKVLKTLPCPGNGLPYCLAYFDDKLWVGTNEGVYTAKVVREESAAEIPFYIESMLVNGQPMDTVGAIVLPSNWSSLGFRFTGIDYQRLGVLEYRYRLLGFRNTWEYSRGRLAQYAGLAPGNYTFEVEVKDNLGNWGNHVRRLSFSVPAPWWQSWWALAMGVFLLLGLVMGVFYLQRRRFKNIQFVTELRSSILRSQMNPHFTFNALTIIRSLILQGKSEEADRILLRFSRLIRKILDLSSREYLTLEEEVAFLTDYLEVERSRANGQFNFQIIQADGLDLMQELPSMVLQPFVENAILHGLRPLEDREGKLEITFEMPVENRLCIRVIDNGVGRGATAQLPKTHESKGLGITEKRLKILDPKARIEITDLYSEDGVASGTQVALQFRSRPLKRY
ncbi:MAG: sensor histidine kinase [Salibacteraceae bacterium]